MKTKIIYISGMHCVSCEKLLEDELSGISGVEKVRADRMKNIVEIIYGEKEPDFSTIKNLIQKFGYDASEESMDSKKKSGKSSWIQWIYAFLIAVIILFLFRVFQEQGFLSNLNINNLSLSFGVAILVGLAASVSSCLAVVGAVVIAFAQKYRTDKKTFWGGAVAPNLLFHAGRLAAFFLLGGILGLIGGEINISGNFVAIYTIIIAAVMAWLGLNILDIIPPISRIGISFPKGLTSNWKKLENSEHKMAPVILGALSFFLPCGFTQSMQILALVSGSFWAGSLGLFFFALGTVPSLLILGVTTSWTKNSKIEIFKKVAGMIILVFSLYILGSGLALRGVRSNIFSLNTQKNTDNSAINSQDFAKKPVDDGTIQTVEMHITSRGFEPSVIRIKKGTPVTWVVYGDSVSGCTNKIIIPSLNIEKKVSSGKNITNFTPTAVGEIPFSCWMGMVRGKFIVE